MTKADSAPEPDEVEDLEYLRRTGKKQIDCDQSDSAVFNSVMGPLQWQLSR